MLCSGIVGRREVALVTLLTQLSSFGIAGTRTTKLQTASQTLGHPPSVQQADCSPTKYPLPGELKKVYAFGGLANKEYVTDIKD